MKKFRLTEDKPARRGDIGITVEDHALIDVGSDVRKVIVPNDVYVIDSNCCANHDNLEFVELSDSVRIIRDRAFYECTNLQVLPHLKNVTELGEEVFNHCRSIPFIVLPETLQKIGDGCFIFCYGMTSACFKGSLKKLPRDSFGCCTELNSVTLPKDLEEIGAMAFYNCPALTKIVFPDTLKSIAWSAFEKTGITNIVLPDGFEVLGFDVFRGCPLKTISLPNTLTYLPARLFYDCKSLTEIEFRGTQEQWQAIGKSPNWHESYNKLRVRCTDGVLAL